MGFSKDVDLLNPVLFLIGLLCVLCLPSPGFPQESRPNEPQAGRRVGKIAFSSSLGGNWQVRVMNPDGTEPVPLTKGSEDFHHPAWSPDGCRLALVTGSGEIKILESDGGLRDLPNLPENCSHPSWSPDGLRLVFSCSDFAGRKEDSDLWVTNFTDGKVQKLLDQPGIQKYPHWSSDGQKIIYTSGYRVGASEIIEELWVVNADGTHPLQLLANRGSSIQPRWSPDGKRIAFASDRSGNMEIWIMGRDGQNLKQLTADKAYAGDPEWSPDGARICFASTRKGKLDVWVMDADGGNPEQLTGRSDSNGESREPNWAP